MSRSTCGANFEFTAHHEHLYEVDALVVADSGVHLVEIKSQPGRFDGDAGTWQRTTPENKFRQMDNPGSWPPPNCVDLYGLSPYNPTRFAHLRELRTGAPHSAEVS